MGKIRTPIPEDVAANVLYRHARTCCVCNVPGRTIQIHHIDDDPSNHDFGNLAVLCLEDHDATQVRGGFGRKLGATEVKLHRDEWTKRVSVRREAADEILLSQMAGQPIDFSLDDESWAAPSEESLAAIIYTLPETLTRVYQSARPFLASTVRPDMMHGTGMITDVLEQSWIRLAAWFPPRHFGGMPPEQYISKFLADRNQWNLALNEPAGPGSGGREAGLIAAADTMSDLDIALVDTVRMLALSHIEDFDFDAWKEQWHSSKLDPNE